MALISSSIPNLVNGVSQQPFTLRLASQAELQENGLSTTSQGLRKRPPTKHLNKILSGTLGNAYIHTINRDENERYVVVITNGDLKVFALDGTEKTVSFPSGKAYLSAASPATSFKAVTVADYTFLVNKSVAVAQSTARASARDFEALVTVKVGNYGKKYAVILDGVERSSYTTPDGSSASHTASISTDNIATQLLNGLTFWGGPGYTFTRYGSVIHIKKTSDFTIRVEDGFNNAAALAIKEQVQSFPNLPANAGVDGFAVEVVGDKQTGFDNFWVSYSTAGSGAWKETIRPNELLGFTDASMPHTLVRNVDGTFTFAPASWDDRTKGTIASNPDPSFVGQKITDIFFYRNRLGFLSDESVIFSEAGEFFNFYRTTVTELLDSDPIDVSVSHTKVSSLLHAVPFNKQLLLFSAQTQFVVDSGELLTPRTISIKQSTEFECTPQASPVGIGKNVYFAVPKGEFSGFREYFAEDLNGLNNDAVEVTSHVPAYVPKNVFKVTPCLNEDLFVALSGSETNAAYVYKFYFNGQEKLQSSWSKWVFPTSDQILNADFILNDLILVIQRADGVYLEKMSVSLGDIGTTEPYNIHLDRKYTFPKASLSFDSGRTALNAPGLLWPLTDGDYEAIVPNGQDKTAGIRLPITVVGGVASVLGDYRNCDLIVGRKYSFRYKLSTITVKQQVNSAQRSDTVGRLQLRTMQLNFSETGYFKVKVTPKGRSTYEYVYSGKTLGLPSATLGVVELETSSIKFPILAQNIGVEIEVTSDAPLPCSLLSADWEGMYVKRSQSV